MKTDENIDFDIQNNVALIGINRPKKLNALSRNMFSKIHNYVAEIDQNRSVRAVIIHSKAARAFGVGADISDWASLAPLEMWRDWVRFGHRIIRDIEELLPPVIAVTNGFTFGGSLELALAADIRIAEKGSQYAFPEVSVGTIPGWMGTQKALQLIGPSKLKKLIFCAQPISADKASAIGLVDDVVPQNKGLPHALDLAEQICKSSPVAVSLAKQIVNGLTANQPVTALESIASGLAAQTEDGHEGKTSFLEKRAPVFKGF
ncbi:MAG: enoyl-CoA hydratase/isomerase family protein [Desulfobacterales bacterium]|nr:enoyl-CoA hydratase/isomerase family protein [Deltaproteobacteria bacterium]NNK93983.1 enoyl-CoA hydratase/isomerase family protein [Desulfobacterales bacterium]